VPVSASSSSRTSPSTTDLDVEAELVGDELGLGGIEQVVDHAHDAQLEQALDDLARLARIFSASSDTVTDSGTRMSSRRTSAGGAGGASTAGVVTRAAGVSAVGLAGAGRHAGGGRDGPRGRARGRGNDSRTGGP